MVAFDEGYERCRAKNSEGPPPTSAPTVPPTTSAPTAQHCDNRVQDSDESDIDCGGNDCRPCAVSQNAHAMTIARRNFALREVVPQRLPPPHLPLLRLQPLRLPLISTPCCARSPNHRIRPLLPYRSYFPDVSAGMGQLVQVPPRCADFRCVARYNWSYYHHFGKGDGNSKHFSNSHERLGLVIYIATVVQVIGGLLRPHKVTIEAYRPRAGNGLFCTTR